MPGLRQHVSPTRVVSGTSPSTSTLSSGDRTFLTYTAQDGEAEIQLGRLAREKGMDAQVKAFGTRMQADHSKAAAVLATIAEQKHVTLSKDLGPHTGLKSRLEKLQGAAFDRAYIAAMVEDHTKAVKAFETASDRAPQTSRARSYVFRDVPCCSGYVR